MGLAQQRSHLGQRGPTGSDPAERASEARHRQRRSGAESKRNRGAGGDEALELGRQNAQAVETLDRERVEPGAERASAARRDRWGGRVADVGGLDDLAGLEDEPA